MRIIYANFKGYIGFNAVMGLDELEIDFSKAKHQICLIVGMNGVGKSTLLSALNIFPDNSSCFMKNKDGSKLLRLIDDTNLYEIEIISQYDGKGGRKPTKAFIRRNGNELNPNGNITSYKEIISNEFELDSNFLGLSMMTSVDRGLGDKTPAERKKFVANVVDNLVTYNEMYKTLNKKSLLYKSHINTLHTKIQSAGDKNSLDAALSQLETQQTEIEKAIEQLNYEIVYIQTKSEIDPEQLEKINEINSKKIELQSQIDVLQSSIDIYENQTKIKPDAILYSYEKDKNLLETYTNTLTEVTNEWKLKQEQLVHTAQTLNQLNASIGDVNYDDSFETAYNSSNNIITGIISNLGSINFSVDNLSILEPLKELVKFFDEIVHRIDTFYDQLSSGDIEYIAYQYNKTNVSELQSQIEERSNKINENKLMIEKYNQDLHTLSILKQRPDKCKINNCPFISEAYKLSKETSINIINKEISILVSDNEELDKVINSLNNAIQYHQSLSSKAIEYQIIINMINNVDIVFDKKSHYGKILANEISNISEKLVRLYSFNLFRDPKVFIEGINLLQQYDSEIKKNEVLKIQYETYKENMKIVESTMQTIINLEEEGKQLIEDTSKLKTKMDSYQDLVEQLSKTSSIKSQYADKVREYNELYQQMGEINLELQKFESKSSEAAHSLEAINGLKMKIDENKLLLQPIKDKISDIKGRLTLLDSYYREYNEYSESFKFIEILKKYCSPTGGGIQTVFMQIYMAKTLELSNQILSMLFGGAYKLIDFIINQNEFSIPFIGPNGIPVDDISSGSNSQICMFGMCINLVLLHQASTKYNIAYLDEIDGGLDHRNRFEFINALYKTIPILGIDQLFMISHSMEADMSNVDIIKLKTYNDFEDVIDTGNIIFDYKNFISNS